ncbi:MAG: phenylacetate--CoA ligase family protein, partial [Planctomycetota bacterium]
MLTSASDHPLYRDTIQQLSLPLKSLDSITAFDFVSKSDLVPEHPQDPSRLFVLPASAYTRLHQTSGSRGFPMPVYDTPQDWDWWMHCWQHVLDAADVTSSDVAMMAFSFGPFIGFWSANDALVQRGALVVAGGGLSSLGRLQMIDRYECTVLCCTPTYALHLANVARENRLDLDAGSVERIIVAGEPGGSVASTRAAIEAAWGAKLID